MIRTLLLIGFGLVPFKICVGFSPTIPIVTEQGNHYACKYYLWGYSTAVELSAEFSFRTRNGSPISAPQFYRFEGPNGPFVMMFHSPTLLYADANGREAVSLGKTTQAVARYSKDELLLVDQDGTVSRVKGKGDSVPIATGAWKPDPSWRFRDVARLSANGYAFLTDDKLAIVEFDADPAAPPKKLTIFPLEIHQKKVRFIHPRHIVGDERGVWIHFLIDRPIKRVGAVYFDLEKTGPFPQVFHVDYREEMISRNLLGFDPVTREAYWIRGSDYVKISPDSPTVTGLVKDATNLVLPLGVSPAKLRRVLFDHPDVVDGKSDDFPDTAALLRAWKKIWETSPALAGVPFSETTTALRALRFVAQTQVSQDLRALSNQDLATVGLYDGMNGFNLANGTDANSAVDLRQLASLVISKR